MNPLNPQHVIHLLLNRYHDGRYLSGHPEVVEWLDSFPDRVYHIQLMADELGVVGYHNVRIWSSKEAMIEAEKRKAVVVDEETCSRKATVEQETEEPLVAALYEACSRKDFQLILELKKKLRDLNIKYDKERTKIRNLI